MWVNSSTIIVELMPPAGLYRLAGAPSRVHVMISLDSMAALDVTLLVTNKTTMRLPEEAWCEFRPILPPHSMLTLDKLGAAVDPSHVVTNGSRTLHNVGDDGARFQTPSGTSFRLRSLDSGLFSPGPADSNMDLYAFPGAQSAATDGVAVSLWNNLWSVNYIFWYPFDASDARFAFRFVLEFPY